MACRIALRLGMVIGLTVLGLTGWAAAQGIRGQPPPRVIHFIPVDVAGKIVDIRPGMIAVATAGKGVWRVGVADNTAISVAGSAAPDVLRPGLHVRFVAAVDKSQGKILGKVEKLTIFTPTNDDARTVGVFLPGQCKPVVCFLEDAAAAPAAVKDTPAKDTRTKDTRAKDTYDIHGQITGGKGNRLTIKVPNKFSKPTLNIELVQEPLIELDLLNYLMAKPGDKVQARGLQLGPTNLQATELLITLSEPLGHARKKPAKLSANRPPEPNPLSLPPAPR